ncbi:MAG: dihydrolipoyl dehydrogenase family protein [Solirubrobacteraceae bacterium]
MTEREFDAIVIGAGPAGEHAAGRLATKGARRVAVVERHLVGGECAFYACMPSKALLRPQELLRESSRVPGASQACGGALDVGVVLSRRDQVIHDFDDSGQLPWLRERGVELIRGHARLVGERRVEVGDELLLAREAVVVAVGSGALMPPIPGLEAADPWTSREVTTAHEVPSHLLVLGGGVVGVEMAQAWRSLGSAVTVVEALEELLVREEPFAGRELREAFEELGIDIHLGARATKVSRQSDGLVSIELEDGAPVTGSHLLVAVGRRPLTEDLGLQTVGLEPGAVIEVDERLRVPGHEWLYAVGDVNGRSLLTHMGKYQARVAADVILGGDAVIQSDGATAPRVVFTDPQLAATGHTLATALAAGIDAKAFDFPTSGTAGASFHGREAAGTTRFVIDLDHDLLVGATFVGPEVADFLQAATIAIAGRVPLAMIARAVAPFPTRSELWLKLIEAYGL